MTKDLYYTIPKYFLDRMRKHSSVRDVEDVSTDEFYLYRIHRVRDDPVLVWLSDAYLFSDMDYHNRPSELGPGDYILVAKPEGGNDVSRELIAEAHIGVGKLAELMGAISQRHTWKYEAPDREESRRRKERWEARRRR